MPVAVDLSKYFGASGYVSVARSTISDWGGLDTLYPRNTAVERTVPGDQSRERVILSLLLVLI